MDKISEFLSPIINTINEYLSDYILIVLLIGVGLLFSIRTRFVQVRCFGEGMKKVFGCISLKGGKKKGGLTSFQALATSIAGQVGTGNIIGACGAIFIGGPGAIFWMWVIAFFGMSTIYAEAVLAQKTKIVQEDGSVLGGPVYYIKHAFKGKLGKGLSIFFAIAAVLALGFMGAMVQSNAISGAINNAFPVIPTWVVGLILAILCTFIFLGGVNRIASVAEKVVPIMAVGFVLIGLIVLGINFRQIPETFLMIFKYAFVPHAILGGAFGGTIKLAVSQGAKRGLFSNEAGLGTTPHAHAQANVKHPHEQGVVAMTGVFLDTFVVLTITALVVISTLYAGNGPLSTPDGITNSNLSGSNMMQTAIGMTFGSQKAGSIIVAICLTFFAFTTIIGWNFFGRHNAEYLFGKKGTVVYSAIAIVFIFLGSLFSSDIVWGLTDMFNNIMVIPNVIAITVLSTQVVNEVKRARQEKIEAKKKEINF